MHDSTVATLFIFERFCDTLIRRDQTRPGKEQRVVKVCADSRKGRRGHDAVEKCRRANPKERRVSGKGMQERVSAVSIVTIVLNDNLLLNVQCPAGSQEKGKWGVMVRKIVDTG